MTTLDKQPVEPLLELLQSAEEVSVEEIASAQPQQRTFVLKLQPKKDSLPSVPAPTPEYSREYLLENARLLIQNGDFLLAQNLYSRLLQNNIQDADALKGLGICLLRLGDRPKAKKCFSALWELHDSEEALVWLGHCYSKEGDDRRAIQTFGGIRTLEALSKEDRFEVLKESGNCYFRLGRETEARVAYLDAMKVRPDSVLLEVNLGMLELQCHRLDDAEKHFQRALDLDAGCSKAFSGLALVAQEREDFFVAEKYFYKALDLDPLNQTALLQLVARAHRCGEFAAISERLKQFVAQEPDNVDVNYAYATVLFKRGRWAECRERLHTALTKDPHHRPSQKLNRELTQNRHPA
ncbi:MAG: tetratricopeptide repeat protein [Bdellovibrionaceae bacterium]|nr:tetratricopeptide repeat protein [Bdellovibrionales bacterium]MCB9255290.1 tetratricopeptide repeat protein [Pseudobdellovibrionaceae bacterium]